MGNSTTATDTPPRHLHIVREEESAYDPAPRRSLGWTVMTQRDTGRALMADLGAETFGIYWLLQSYADADGRCWPSYETIAKQSRVSVRQLTRIISTLAERGYLTVERRGGSGGGRFSNAYCINDMPTQPATVADSNLPHGQIATGNLPKMQEQPATMADEEISNEEESKKKENSLVQEQFEEFYRRYPRHEARKRAESAWRNLTAKKRAAALAALDTYRFSPDPKYVPLPASWLNAERWNDEQAPAKKGGLVF